MGKSKVERARLIVTTASPSAFFPLHWDMDRETLSIDEYNTLFKRCLAHAIKILKNKEKAEDTAHDAILRILKQPAWRETFLESPKNCYRPVVDAIRDQYGRNPENFHQNRELPISKFEVHSPIFPTTQIPDSDPLKPLLLGSPPILHAILVLSCKWGFTHKEIAQIFGLPETTILGKLDTLRKKRKNA